MTGIVIHKKKIINFTRNELINLMTIVLKALNEIKFLKFLKYFIIVHFIFNFLKGKFMERKIYFEREIIVIQKRLND